MGSLFQYLSGNVPGGLTLYLLLLLVTLAILLFMYRVNELFTRKHVVRWAIVMFLVYTIAYVVIWYKYPPQQYFKRYHVAIFQSDTADNWLGEYLTDILTDNLDYYQNDHEYLFPFRWLYRMSPADSAGNPHFTRRIYRKTPVQRVLAGRISRGRNGFEAELQILQFPGGKVLHTAHGNFHLSRLGEFVDWVAGETGNQLPFRQRLNKPVWSPADSLLVLAKRAFYQSRYKNAKRLLVPLVAASPDWKYRKWLLFTRIRLAGEERMARPPLNPYSNQVPPWQKELREARKPLLDALRKGDTDLFTKVMVAESYIFEEDFASAEVFLKQAFVENPFDIDVLLNFSFLHPSRYQLFGFQNVRAIYRRILTYCPIEEQVLLKWSGLIVKGDPSFTAPPNFAKDFVRHYLELNPYSVNVWLMLGQLYAAQGLRDRALEAYQKAEALRPNDGLIHYNMGVLFYEWEKYDRAKRYFLKSIRENDYLDSHLYLGAIYKNEGNCRDALKEFRYRVAHKQGENDYYAYQAMKGIQECLKKLGELPPGEPGQ